nr:hypothetical protein [Tanacetum cinerariifolium]
MFVPMESEGQVAYSKAGEGSSKEGESLKRPAEEELGQEQQKKQQDLLREFVARVVGKMGEWWSGKKSGESRGYMYGGKRV